MAEELIYICTDLFDELELGHTQRCVGRLVDGMFDVSVSAFGGFLHSQRGPCLFHHNSLHHTLGRVDVAVPRVVSRPHGLDGRQLEPVADGGLAHVERQMDEVAARDKIVLAEDLHAGVEPQLVLERLQHGRHG